MLWFSAWTTIRHPILKRAVWSQRWITRYTPEAAKYLQYLDICVRITAPQTKWGIRDGDKFTDVAWYVRQNLLAKGLPLQSLQVKKSVPFLHATNQPCLILRWGITPDSRAIRHQGLSSLNLDHNPLSYGAEGVATTSEEGQAQNLREEISDRFGYRVVKHDDATCDGWGELKGINGQRSESKKQSSANVVEEAMCAS